MARKAKPRPVRKPVPTEQIDAMDAFLSSNIHTEEGRDFLKSLYQRLDEPSALNLLDRLAVLVDRADMMILFERASFLEGTLRTKRGRIRFEWDGDEDGPLLPFLVDAIKNGEPLPEER